MRWVRNRSSTFDFAAPSPRFPRDLCKSRGTGDVLEDAGTKSPCAQYHAFLVVNQPGLCEGNRAPWHPLPPDNDRDVKALAAFSLRGSVLSQVSNDFCTRFTTLLVRVVWKEGMNFCTLETWFDELGYWFLRNRRDRENDLFDRI